jgi:hypothetical protein
MLIFVRSFVATAIALSMTIGDVDAQQSSSSYPEPFPEPFSDRFPESFPGSMDFPEPGELSDLPPAYPAWPEMPPRREIPPLPPGGPYMSSALSDVDEFPADTGGLRDEFHREPMPSPFFEADMPWPEVPERGAPQVWMPEGGDYHYVPDEVMRQLESPAYGRRPLPMPMYQRFPGYPPRPPMGNPYYGYR